jgi:hypothetical protein
VPIGDNKDKSVSNTDLLKELKIERHQREEHRSGGGPGPWPWIIGGIVLVLLALGGGWW